jgi:hypothetical protein
MKAVKATELKTKSAEELKGMLSATARVPYAARLRAC